VIRPGAAEMMRRDSDHLQGVYDLLRKRTRLRVQESEEILKDL